jgi:pimeloyl-ACP methyl ester carboxylesterase
VRLAAALPHAALVTFEDAGHGAHLSHPDQLAAAVRRARELGFTAPG